MVQKKKCESVKKLGKAKEFFLIAARYRQIAIIKLLAYVHSKLIG